MEIYEVAIVPFIVGLVELLKRIGLPGKFGALAAAIIGVLIGVYYLAPEDIFRGVFVGLSLGLAASGLYSGTKNTAEAAKTAVRSFKKNKSSIKKF